MTDVRPGGLVMLDAPDRLPAIRLIVGYGAIACALPYLALKVVWLSGGTIGVANPEVMGERSMIALNALTAGMDLVGVALALAFTHRWGLRIPAWLLLPPIWIAGGLLARFVVGVPVAAVLAALVSGVFPPISGGLIHPWVYIVVYVEFAGLGIGLLAAFFLYAMTRWAETLRAPTRMSEPGLTHDVQVVLANTAALLASVLGAWSFAAAVGAASGTRTVLGAVVNGVDAALAIAAAAGVLMMAHRVGSGPFWVPLAMTWIGAGSLFGWGLWHMINVLGQTALLRGRPSPAIVNLLGLLRLIVGLMMGQLMIVLVAERRQRPAP